MVQRPLSLSWRQGIFLGAHDKDVLVRPEVPLKMIWLEGAAALGDCARDRKALVNKVPDAQLSSKPGHVRLAAAKRA